MLCPFCGENEFDCECEFEDEGFDSDEFGEDPEAEFERRFET